MKDLDRIDAWDFELPTERIASEPPEHRGDSRLLHLDATGAITDRGFGELVDQLRPGDILVFNDTKVLTARLWARRSTGGRVELLVVGGAHESDWSPGAGEITAMLRSNRTVRVGEEIYLEDARGTVSLTRLEDDAEHLAHLRCDEDLFALMERFGQVPLPPYIEEQRRRRGEDVIQARDRERYQSIMAEVDGAVAAPTASLHFDNACIQKMALRGVDIARVTLHVGIGTFRPVKVERLSEHDMHAEVCVLEDDVAERLAQVRRDGGRVIAVGTTVVRTLESFANADGTYRHGRLSTNLFIRPGYQFLGIDALVTNFHLPKSTLLALVAAFSGYDAVMEAYRHAVDCGYRFFSYGDAMFLEGVDERASED